MDIDIPNDLIDKIKIYTPDDLSIEEVIIGVLSRAVFEHEFMYKHTNTKDRNVLETKIDPSLNPDEVCIEIDGVNVNCILDVRDDGTITAMSEDGQSFILNVNDSGDLEIDVHAENSEQDY